MGVKGVMRLMMRLMMRVMMMMMVNENAFPMR
ncbi:hypothetical protein LINPERHAP2_LOCUS23420 [Linum perenne]